MRYKVINQSKGTNINVGTVLEKVQWGSDGWGLAAIGFSALWVHKGEVTPLDNFAHVTHELLQVLPNAEEFDFGIRQDLPQGFLMLGQPNGIEMEDIVCELFSHEDCGVVLMQFEEHLPYNASIVQVTEFHYNCVQKIQETF